MNVIRKSIIFSTVAALLRCANPDFSGPSGEGNGSETIARGVIVDSMGVPAVGVPVRLLPAAYNPVAHDTLPAEWRSLSDAKGEYRLGGISAGTYALEAGFATAGLKALVKCIEITGRKIEVAVDTGRLRKTGTILVQLAGLTRRTGDYMYLPGTSVFAVIAARDSVAGQAVVSGVPSGKFTHFIYVAVADSQNVDLLKDTLTVRPGDTVVSAYAAWKYMRKLFLNTTVSGADVKGNVYNFPVFVRLNNAAFDFSQAKSGGEDIRFAKSDGSTLAHEIERWDEVNHKAEIWVKVDTVFGNNSAQYIAMYWGNPDADDSSNGSSVFDTAAGFQGVWHLGDASKDSVRDATLNRYHGVSPDTARPSFGEGVIGRCRAFDGDEDFITMPNTATGNLNFPQNGHYSVSAWVKVDTFVELPQMVASKGKFQYVLWLDSTLWEFNEYQDKSGWDVTAQKATVKQWVLLTGVRDGVSQYIYVNGEPADSIFNRPCTESDNIPSDFFIGRARGRTALPNGKDDYYSYKGCIDEVRVYSAARSGDWIKLCYMNQRIDDRLVAFK